MSRWYGGGVDCYYQNKKTKKLTILDIPEVKPWASLDVNKPNKLEEGMTLVRLYKCKHGGLLLMINVCYKRQDVSIKKFNWSSELPPDSSLDPADIRLPYISTDCSLEGQMTMW